VACFASYGVRYIDPPDCGLHSNTRQNLNTNEYMRIGNVIPRHAKVITTEKRKRIARKTTSNTPLN
jgi:hypothetical protein